MKDELVSVIIPVYNVEKYLEKCIESVISQTYNNIEIILVDDGSTDKSCFICDKYCKKDDRIRVIHKKNGGLSEARNTGIENSKGEYITFIDSDDYVDKKYIQYLYELITEYSADMGIYDCNIIKSTKKERKKVRDIKENRCCLEKKECILRMLYTDFYFISTNSKIFKRKLFENVRYPKGKLFEDVGTTYKLILECDSIACSNKKIYNYVIRDDSITTQIFGEKHLDLIEMTNQMCDDIVETFPEMKNDVLRRKIYANISTLNRILLSKSECEEKKKIINYIKNNGKKVLNNRKVIARDKIAIILIGCNIKLYKYFLDIYKKK